MPYCHLIAQIETGALCNFGCNRVAKYSFVVSHKKEISNYNAAKIKQCCSPHYNSCPYKKEKQSQKISGASNVMWGKKHSAESIEKMRGSRPSVTGEKNPAWGRVFHHTEQSKRLISIAAAKSTKNIWHKSFSGRAFGMLFRSSFELFFIIQNYPNIRSNEGADPVLINYCGHKHYKPDFFIDDTLIEIKPAYALKDVTVQKKSQAAQKWCQENNYKYKVVTQDEIIFDFNRAENLVASGDVVFNNNGLERFRKVRPRYEKLFRRRPSEI